MPYFTANTKGESAETVFEKIKDGTIEMRGQCLDQHDVVQKEGQENDPGKGTDGWSTVEVDSNGDITAKVDSDFTPNRTDDVWKDWKNKMMAAAQQCASKGVDMGVYQKDLMNCSGQKWIGKKFSDNF